MLRSVSSGAVLRKVVGRETVLISHASTRCPRFPEMGVRRGSRSLRTWDNSRISAFGYLDVVDYCRSKCDTAERKATMAPALSRRICSYCCHRCMVLSFAGVGAVYHRTDYWHAVFADPTGHILALVVPDLVSGDEQR